MRRFGAVLVFVAGCMLAASPSQATIIGVSGPLSSMGAAPAIIGAPSDALDDIVTNTGMEGFNEAQNVVTSVAHSTDSGAIAAGTRVNSHMILLNSPGSASLSHVNVVWTFLYPIIGVMSDQGGTLEAASTFELGNPATNYTVTFPGSGPAAPYGARGLEGGLTPGGDFYTVSGNQITVDMFVSEPGDWIRVVTQVPEPGTMALLGGGLLSLFFRSRRRRG